jgi:predicted DNA-binding transcriptional regulator AlpA
VSQYLTVKDVAKKLNICRASVYNYLKAVPGFPQPMKLGRMSRWSAEEVDSFMSSAPRGVYGEGR